MKKRAMFCVAIAAVVFISSEHYAFADNGPKEFATLDGIAADVMSATEMSAVQGLGDVFNETPGIVGLVTQNPGRPIIVGVSFCPGFRACAFEDAFKDVAIFKPSGIMFVGTNIVSTTAFLHSPTEVSIEVQTGP